MRNVFELEPTAYSRPLGWNSAQRTAYLCKPKISYNQTRSISQPTSFTWASSNDVTAMKRGFPAKPLPGIVVEADTDPDPSDPDPDVGPEVEAVDPFWLAGNWGCNQVRKKNKKNMKKKEIPVRFFYLAIMGSSLLNIPQS